MRKTSAQLVLVLLIIFLAACDRNDDNQDDAEEGLGPLDWDRNAQNIILRVDESFTQSPPAVLANEIPACTVWGDGRAIWVNRLPDSKEIREGRLDDDAMRELIQFVVFSGFYDWESDFLIPEMSNPMVQSITLNLYAENRTVTRYSSWPVDGYQRILETCQQAVTTPALFEPAGAWVSAYDSALSEGTGSWRWLPDSAGFRLSEVTNGQAPRWVTGEILRLIWANTVLPRLVPRVVDGDAAYELAVRVPNITRDAPPPPTEAGAATLTPAP
jgi:hypothetical protein